ncbi:MAG: ABC transporter permease [Planctomycetota bacterium]
MWLVLVAGTAALWFLLRAQGAAAVAGVVYVVGGLAWAGWTAAGLVWWREQTWVGKLSRVVVLNLGMGLLTGFCAALGADTAVAACLGIWGMALAFGVGLELMRLALSPGWSVLGVARTVVDEAIRMRMGLVFVVMLVLLVPVLPWMLGGETRLQYRLESFLTYALTVVSVLLSAMTILLAARTVSSELGDKQAYLTLTKPVSRPGYLLGKWLGIMALNGLLLGVSGVGVYGFVRVLERTPAMDAADRVAVQEQVLTARALAEPRPVDSAALAIDFEARLADLRRRGVDPTVYGEAGDPVSRVSPTQRARIEQDAVKQWLTIDPRERKTYRFEGLGPAKDAGPSVQLRFKPRAASAPADGRVRLAMRVNDRPYQNPEPGLNLGQPIPPVRDNTFHTAYISTQQIRDDGTLDLTIINTGAELGQTSVAFAPGEGLQVYYKVGGFAGNLTSGLAMVWIRLGFLGALGLAAATFLGFPVACLACFLVFFAAVGSNYLSESLSTYAGLPREEVPWWDTVWLTVGKFNGLVGQGEFYDAFKLVVRIIGEAFTFIVPPMARFSPTAEVAYGRAISGGLLLECLVRIGVVSTGVVALFAVGVFGRREVARVTV